MIIRDDKDMTRSDNYSGLASRNSPRLLGANPIKNLNKLSLERSSLNVRYK